jgi:hypothetical protein
VALRRHAVALRRHAVTYSARRAESSRGLLLTSAAACMAPRPVTCATRDELRAALEADHSARHAADPCAWAAKILLVRAPAPRAVDRPDPAAPAGQAADAARLSVAVFLSVAGYINRTDTRAAAQ